MTREEAKRFGYCILAVADADADKDTIEFTKIALEALEKEPKTGHWVKKSQYGNDYCSECGYELLMYGKPKFCPDCGVKMESEEKE